MIPRFIAGISTLIGHKVSLRDLVSSEKFRYAMAFRNSYEVKNYEVQCLPFFRSYRNTPYVLLAVC